MNSKPGTTGLADCFQQFFEMQHRHREIFETEILNIAKEHMKKKKGRNGRKKNEIVTKPVFNFQNNLSSILEEALSNPESTNPPRTTQRTAAKIALQRTTEQLKQTLNEKLRNESGSSIKNYSVGSTSSASKKMNVSKVSESVKRGMDSNLQEELKVSMVECVVVLDRCDSYTVESNNMRSPEVNFVCPVDNKEDGDGHKSQQPLNFEHSKSSKTSTTVANSHLLKCQNNDESSCLDLFSHESVSEPKTLRSRKLNGSVKTGNCESLSSNQSELKEDASTSSNEISIKPPYSKSNEPSKEPAVANVIAADSDNLDCFIFPAPEVTVPIIKIPEVVLNRTNDVEKCEFAVPASVRPKRIRTKNKKYDNDYSYTMNKTYNKDVSCNNEVDSNIDASESLTNKSNSRRRGKKRKSEDDNSPNKSLKINIMDKNQTNGSSSSTNEANTVSTSSDKSSVPDNLVPSVKCNKLLIMSDSGSVQSPENIRSRTKILEKASVKNIVVISDEGYEVPSSSHQREDASEITKTNLQCPIIRVSPPIAEENQNKRMTRTRTRELGKNKVQMEKENSFTTANNMIMSKHISEIKNGKENLTGHSFKFALLSSEKRLKTTPLASNNFIFTPLSGKSGGYLNKITPLSIESLKKGEKSAVKLPQRNVVAQERKDEFMKAKIEKNKRKREEKAKRALAHRQAVEKEQQEKIAKLIKENEERERLLAENKRQKEEQILMKKQNAEMMLKEAEERRLKEEEAKQAARLKKLEEERKRAAELRLKQAEEAKKNLEMKLALEAEKTKLKEAELAKQLKMKQKVDLNSYQLTPCKEECLPKPPKNDDDYGLSDNSDASTDDEKQPKKIVPKWATRQSRSTQIMIQGYVHMNLLESYFPLVFDETNRSLLTKIQGKRPRNSSAVWNTPDIAF